MKLRKLLILGLIFSSLVACSEHQDNKYKADGKVENKVSEKPNLPISIPDDWRIILVNRDHILSENQNVELESINKNAHPNMKVDRRILHEYQDMVTAAKEEGINLYLLSSFRTIELQKSYYDATYKLYKSQGFSNEDAANKVLEYIQYPGASEHHTGLALDIISMEWQQDGKELSDRFDTTSAFKWLNMHAANYGFILRYPKGKEKITGINYEPWHYRYVGKEVAIYLKKENITLEEYHTKIKEDISKEASKSSDIKK
ncbi:M15 family metallopeptidase [Bacillus cereus]|uniref:M15 family metallopeptidase n=1 Tax=Bacillus cereus TaxID=1396 RepID=UPI000BF31663|nr:M15 family metallopeptidase [Bacillus cereus]PER82225.1 D-Ala-D-Ala carboxypeptidase VanY [Bacillus cereus]